MSRLHRCIAVPLGLVAVCVASLAGADDDHVRVRLVSDLDRFGATDSFRLGVVLEPEPGWHIYWRYPGSAGLATEVAYELPGAFRVGELQWPTPVSFVQPGDIIGYGYESPVVLAAEVTVPDIFDQPVPVDVTASWLACKEICVLGEARLEAELPLDGAARRRAEAAFEGWRESLPTPVEPDRVSISTTGGPVAASGTTRLVVWLQWTEVPAAVEFFPDPGSALKIDHVRARSRGQLTRIDIDVTRIQGTAEPAHSLSAVVATTDSQGRRTGRSLTINLD